MAKPGTTTLLVTKTEFVEIIQALMKETFHSASSGELTPGLFQAIEKVTLLRLKIDTERANTTIIPADFKDMFEVRQDFNTVMANLVRVKLAEKADNGYKWIQSSAAFVAFMKEAIAKKYFNIPLKPRHIPLVGYYFQLDPSEFTKDILGTKPSASKWLKA